ncbi:MAG: DegT/DnrJ/EryC1/StrS family aminotransferase [Armatimonadota bacterium]|nr:DegT/DnrJ/EryC1/StrS family aminotransferase [Armatimonadota bacterium]
MSTLAINSGPKAVTKDPGDIFVHPIIDDRDERAVVEMLHSRQMSAIEPSLEFEEMYAAWQGTGYALAHNTGTAALYGAFYGVGVGEGDEVICPTVTYWASAMPVLSLRGVVVFADIEEDTLCIDPEDVRRKITDRTKAIVAVHLYGHPADMDPLMEISEETGVPVIEDVSHAHGARYKGRLTGSIGQVSAMSIMTGKALPTSEGGVLCTDDQEIHERAIVFGHYGRIAKHCEIEKYRNMAGLAIGGHKFRMNGFSAAMAKVQLEKYPGILEDKERSAELWWGLLEDVPGIVPHSPKWQDSTLGGWYAPHGIYDPEQAPGNLPLKAFARAVQAEGSVCGGGGYRLLHRHPAFNDLAIYGEEVPTAVRFAEKDWRMGDEDLPTAMKMYTRVYRVPRFAYFDEEYIRQCADAYRKVMEHADQVPVEEDDYTEEGLGVSGASRHG